MSNENDGDIFFAIQLFNRFDDLSPALRVEHCCRKPNPYTRGTRHNACAFCPYGTICHERTVEGRRNYEAISAQQFWDEISKEVSENE